MTQTTTTTPTTQEVSEALNVLGQWLLYQVELYFGAHLALDPDTTAIEFGLRFVAALFPLVVIVVFAFSATIRIIRKAGYSGGWIIPLLIPVVNVCLVLGFAVAKWPLEKRLARAKWLQSLRARQAREDEISSGRYLFDDGVTKQLPEDYRDL